MTFGLIYSYILQHLVDEHGAVVGAFQDSLPFCFLVHLGEQLGLFLVCYWYLFDGCCQESASPAFAGRGELAVGGRILIYDAVSDCS